jgi:glycosyltransferase involved in cell wall biosynthesis
MASPMRVLELRSVRGTGGGPEKTILLGTAHTDPAHCTITVGYIRDQRDGVFGIDQWAQRIGIDYVEIRERHSFDPAIWAPLKRLVRDRTIQIVHSHDYKTNLIAWMLARSEGIIPLSTVHGWTGHSPRERFLYYPADKRVLARFPRLIAVSSDIRNELIRCGAKPRRVTVVLNGIDHKTFYRDRALRGPARLELGLADGEIAVGAVGRLEPQKRFDLLLKAIADTRSRWPNLRLLIAGDGSAATSLGRMIQDLNLQDSCRLIGHCPDVARFHHALDLFVQSSDYEGTPNSVLEAMALGTPIVATDAGGTSELVVDGVHGLVVHCGSASVISAAIEQALNDPAGTQARTLAARVRIERELSFERRMQRVEGIYRDLLARTAAPPGQVADTHAIT